MSVSDTQLYISDDFEHKYRITVNIPDKEVYYTKKDVANIIDGCLAVMEDCLKRGEDLSIYGIGTLGVKYRAPRMVKTPGSDVYHQVPEHYAPNVQFGNIFKTAAKIYGANLKESQINLPDPIYDIGDRPIEFEYDMFDEDGEDDG